MKAGAIPVASKRFFKPFNADWTTPRLSASAWHASYTTLEAKGLETYDTDEIVGFGGQLLEESSISMIADNDIDTKVLGQLFSFICVAHESRNVEVGAVRVVQKDREDRTANVA